MPIIGEGDEEANDSFVEQLVTSAEAAVDEVVRRGVSSTGVQSLLHSTVCKQGHSCCAFNVSSLLFFTVLYCTVLDSIGLFCTVQNSLPCMFCSDSQVASRDRIAIGGHSYGAFMAANLLAHAPGLFCCGIAQSGAYNRTLTPFSFQVYL